MKSTEIVAIDIASPNGPPPVVHAVAGDIYSRFLQMHLYAGGVPFEPPSGTTCTIGWRRQNGDSGAYNSILEEDGSSSHPAWELEGNVLTIELDWHVCQHPGDVAVNVSLNGEGGSRLHTWELCCRVARGAVADADDPTKPSESATEAANRAEAAAAEAQDSAADLEDAVKRAEAAAQRAESLAPTEGLVNSVNGKGGVVVLDAYDVGALPSPATTAGVQAGMLLAVKEVTSDGKIITEAVQPPNDAGYIEMEESIPVEQRKYGTLYSLITHNLSDEDEPVTYNN